ncbi:MAG TPA: amidase [Roseiarcus sp.]|jgi:aspartyl-tRNA(Asn)/glutamyl-tRNA(Gln) amidotransferase subunit A|nr:amidase [Roseiarcus sp.]
MVDKLFTLSQVRQALASGASSATRITERALAEVERENAALKAFVTLDAKRALIDAGHVDALIASGASPGPLAGVPIGVKDLIDVAGLPTKAGSLTRADAPPAAVDAPTVARLRAAGAIILGKTHTVEYAFGGWGTNETMGTPLNPRDRAHPRTPGGSSSGSGVAVAAGLVPAALGSDTGGSVRLPASFCGCVGLKTTIGLIDINNTVPLAPIFDTIGPMTNTVADAAALLAVLAPAQDDRSPGWTDRIGAVARGGAGDVQGLRIAIIANAGIPLHAETARVFAETRARLIRLGAREEEIILPETLADLSQPLGEIMAAESYRLNGHFAESPTSRMDGPVRRRILAGREIRAHRLNALFEHRRMVKQAFGLIFQRFDALLAPTTPLPAPLIAEYDENTSPGLFTRFVNYLDLAALSLPMGATANGLPIGMQIVTPGLHEPRALEIGAALEVDRGAVPLV